MSLQKVVLYPNAENDTGFKTAQSVAARFENGGCKTVICPYPDTPGLAGVDMLVTFGGDGTILKAARMAAETGTPILGVNMGGKGFIAELEPDEISLIDKIIAGGFDTETRMMLDIEVLRGGETVRRDFALNDAVIKGDNKVIEMTVFADGQKITRFSGDGTIIATPTGSTAYSMSAGGPIVEPSANNIIITPICAHILEAKSYVLTAGREVTVEPEFKAGTSAYLSADGGEHTDIKRGDTIRIFRSGKTATLVKTAKNNFYNRLSAKLISHTNT